MCNNPITFDGKQIPCMLCKECKKQLKKRWQEIEKGD